jgi:predicted transcriptional regulator of viral defense system
MLTKQTTPSKTLGPRSALLVTALHERARPIFTLAEAQSITGLNDTSARTLVHKLVGRGVATRLRPGVFQLVPPELGREREYMGNPYVVARELMGGKPYYLSHASAMDIHDMVTQPQLVVCVTSPKPMRGRSVLGTEFRFIRCKPEHFFGTTDHWVTKQEKVTVSDLERTVLDGLRQPEYCGGVTEVAKGLWIRRTDMSVGRLVEYAIRLGVGAVMHRLGFLLEVYDVGTVADRERLRENAGGTYSLLDPILPSQGKYTTRWHLRLNVDPDEFRGVIGT